MDRKELIRQKAELYLAYLKMAVEDLEDYDLDLMMVLVKDRDIQDILDKKFKEKT